MGKTQWTIGIEPPVMSWDKPIEDELLEWVRYMKKSWQSLGRSSIWPHVRKEARSIIIAYESMEKKILNEKDLRAKIKAGRLEREVERRANTKPKSKLARKGLPK